MSWWIESNPRDFTLGAAPIELSNGDPESNSSTRPLRPVLTTIVALEDPDQSSMELPERGTPSATATSQAYRGYDARIQVPTTRLTRHQLAYLFLHQALPSMFIAGLLNLLVGYGIYATPRLPPGPPPSGSIPPFLFHPPLSLLTDAAFTTIIQCVITWLCLVVLVNGALSRGLVAPHAPRWVREPRWGGMRWFCMLDHYNRVRGSSWSSGRWCAAAACRGSGKGGRVGRWVGFWLGAVGRGLLVAVGAFAVMVGPMIGICAAVGTRYEGDWVFLGRWDGVVFKAVYGGVLGLVLSPALAWMWMLRAGWIVNRHAVV
ncbi:hypothetical protein F5144DRAFT_626764 [Chaetomium tenue]|uniref:Uncharacterized protein n=1 Tax=Chaetomium tenue TaxID=1854479 RepID=A0ACB7PG77_9PEZI|nr:hypothetical protein F5144DRAFT_626764 [Chaetomium globosum]